MLDIPCESFPYITEPYRADHWDLTDEPESRNYWLDTLLSSTEKTATIALESQPNASDALDRSNEFKRRYVVRLNELRSKPGSYGRLTVRKLLNMREDLLNELGFSDTYIKLKKLENEYFLGQLSDRFDEIDSISDPKIRWEEIVRGVLAGNVFDWGAKAVTDMLDKESGGIMQFSTARNTLQPRPWLIDHFEPFVEEITKYKCVCIFADNSGADIVLGIMPFVRELLRCDKKVILVVNSRPALNDVTIFELQFLLQQARRVSTELDRFISNGQLLAVENGSGSPCLNLKSMPTELCELLLSEKCDLLVFEGMGRAIHTNFAAQFTIDSLKLAVLKNKWIAEKHGGRLFDVVCKFDKKKGN